MKAELLFRQKLTSVDGNLKELAVWSVATDEKYPEGVRYRMAFIPYGRKQPTVLYDNHHPKGHHKHLHGKESVYSFINVDVLIEDFEKDIASAKRKKRSSK